MHFVTGFDWMISCTTEFESTVAFMRDVLGLGPTEHGIRKNDPHFSRSALAVLPDGRTLAVAEPAPSAERLRGRQVLCLTVRDFSEAKQELSRRGAVFASATFDDGQGLAWTYVQAPDGNVYQICGPIAGGMSAVAGTGEFRAESGTTLLTGFDWMLSCTVEFASTIAFVEDVLGLDVARRGNAQVDARFSRYALAVLAGGATLEVVEPTPVGERLRGRQVPCLTVPDVIEAMRQLEQRGAAMSEVVNDGKGLAWTYVQAPDGNVYQIYGPAANRDGLAA